MTPADFPTEPAEAARALLAPRYEMLELLGRGASALVYRVRDLHDGGRIKAAKISWLASEDREREARRAAIIDEFLLAARFRHPHLVAHYDLHLMDDHAAAITTMECVPGRPLSEALAGRDGATVGRAFVQLLRALQLLHDFGCVHADVKPTNVLCALEAGRPRVKLLDYHLAYRPGAGQHGSRGTLRYLSPEALKGDAVDARGDLYAVGVLLYEVLAGRPLFDGNPEEIARKHLSAPVPDLAGGDEIGRGLERVALRLLSKDREGRHRSAWEAAREILDAIGDVEPAETMDTLLGRLRSVPLIGRDDALAAARRALDPSRESPLRVVRFQGRAGIGRSRMLEECERLAQTFGWRTVRLRPGEPLPPVSGRTACFVDDLDAATARQRETLEDALRAAHGLPLRCFVAEGADGKAESEDAVIALRELDETGKRALARSALPRSVPETLISDLVACCGGAPGVLLGTIEHVLRSGALVVEQDGQARCEREMAGLIPDALAEETVRAYQQSTPAMARLIEMLAVAQSEVEAGILAAALDATAADLRRAVDAGPAAPLVAYREEGGVAWLRLPHVACGGRILAALPESRARGIHDRLAQAYAAARGETRAAALRHRLQGSHPAEAVPALLEMLRTRDPLCVPHDEAALLAELARPHAEGAGLAELLELGGDAASAAGDQLGAEKMFRAHLDTAGASRRVIRKLGLALARSQRGDEARALFAEAEELPGSSDTAEAISRALDRGDLEREQANFLAAKAHYEEALNLARQAGDARAETRARMMAGAALCQVGMPEQSRPFLLTALWAYRRMGDRLGMAQALHYLAHEAMLRSDSRRSLAIGRRAAVVLVRAGCLLQVARIRSLEGACRQRRYDWPAAISAYESALSLYRKQGDRLGESTVLGNLCQCNTTLGRLEPAMDYARRALEITENRDVRHRAWTALGWVQSLIGDHSAARETAQAVILSAQRHGLPVFVEAAERLLGRQDLLHGRHEDAIVRMRNALAVTQQTLSQMRQAVCLVRLAEALLAAGRIEEAKETLAASRQRAGREGTFLTRALAESVRGRMALQTGEFDVAREAYLNAYRTFHVALDWEELIEAARHLGELYQRAGQLRFAGFYFRVALDTAERVYDELRVPRNRELFMNDPRRVALWKAIHNFHGAANPERTYA